MSTTAAPDSVAAVLVAGMPRDPEALALALCADPADEGARRALLDWLEESGDGRAAEARAIMPDADAVILQAWPGARLYWLGVREVANCPGRGVISVEGVRRQILGTVSLADPEVLAAARVVRGRVLLRLLLGEGP